MAAGHTTHSVRRQRDQHWYAGHARFFLQPRTWCTSAPSEPKQSFCQGGGSSWGLGNKQIPHIWESWNLQDSQGISYVLQTEQMNSRRGSAAELRKGDFSDLLGSPQTTWRALGMRLSWVIAHAGMSVCCYSHFPITPVPVSDPWPIALGETPVETPWFTALFCDFSFWTGESVHGFSAGDVSHTTDPGILWPTSRT